MNSKLPVVLCVALHAILVLIYSTILASYKAGTFNRPLSLSQETTRTAITVISPSFTIAYCAILVLITQRITLNEFLKRPQTLSAIHDKSSAWLGLGSSLLALTNQGKLVTDLPGISMITAYLLLLFIVHTTLPGLFSVTTQDMTVIATHPTVLARQPNVTSMLGLGVQLNDLCSILTVHDVLNTTAVGVSDNMVYDIIPLTANATGSAQVNAVTFSVDCASLPDASLTAFYPDGDGLSASDSGSSGPAYNFRFGGDRYLFTVSPMAPGSLHVAGLNLDGEHGPSTLIVASTVPIVDSAGTNATVVNINPQWQQGSETDPVSSIYVVGCNFSSRNSTMNINAQSQIVDYTPPVPTAMTWHDWTDPGVSADPLLTDTLQLFADSAPPSTASYEQDDINVFNATFQTSIQVEESLVDQFIIANAFLTGNASQYFQSITAGELNWSLGRAYAAVLWYCNTAGPSLTYPAGENQLVQGAVSISSLILQSQVTINTISLFAGLAASCALLVVAVTLLAKSGSFTHHIDDHNVSGLLPVLWLLSDEPRLATVKEPNLDALRAAGMYEVSTIEELQRRVGTGKDGNRSEEHELWYPLSEASQSPVL
ncbi:hypothetical protein NM688_g5846 [Phlebia brevispora]|uniref:Uncharacterized protein n=1 Tax=Phlebia brevispora TaxID=194682 RepID=A0ACC1SNR0_9APHY|nr:hypothetical protein NM688_g5846 [Phlebia brevispora]